MSQREHDLSMRLKQVVARHAQGDLAVARPEAEALLVDVEQAGLSAADALRIRCVEVLTVIRIATGDAAAAVALVDRELALEGGHSPRLWMARAQLANALGQADEAITLARRAEDTAAAHHIVGHGAECATLAAQWMLELGDVEGATDALDRAEARTQELAPVHRASVLYTRAQLWVALGRPERAEALEEQRLTLARSAGLSGVEASALERLGRYAWDRGERRAAVVRFREQQGILQILGDRVGLGRASNNLGELYRQLGDLDLATEAYVEALARLEHHPASHAIVRVNLALVALESGDERGAAETFAALAGEVELLPSLRAVVALGQLPAQVRDGGWRAVDVGIEVVERSMAELTAHDADLVPLVFRAVDAIDDQASSESERARAARLLVFLHDWAERFGRAEVDAALARLQAIAAKGALVPLGPFTLVSPLGRGASGDVWLGRHGGQRLEVAVKILRADAGEGLHTELASVARLDHPHVAWLLHEGRVSRATHAMVPELAAGSPWLAVELVPGGTLGDVAGTLPWASVLRVLLGLLDALAHAHARGVLHLDVKPSNVLLGGSPERPVPKLVDFGLARALASPSAERVAGSPFYMAPEQFIPGANLAPQTDLYALGCLATTLVQGVPPFEETTIEDLRRAHTWREPPPIAPRIPVPEGFEEWVKKLLAKPVRSRFSSAAETARALRALPDAPAGPVGLPGVPAPRLSDFSLTTVVLDDELPIGAPLDSTHPGSESPIHLPATWRSGRDLLRPPGLQEAGLGLFALRCPRVVGRESERDRLWSVVHDAVRSAERRVIGLRGPTGAGRRTLAAWLAERTRELGAPSTLVRRDGAHAPIGAEVVIVLDGDPAAAALLADPSAEVFDVLPLTNEEVGSILDGRLPLAPDLRASVIRRAAGLPGVAVTILEGFVADRRLLRRSDGWDLRPGSQGR